MLAAAVILALTYLFLSFQDIPGVHLPRPAAALLGAVAMVVFGVVTLEQAYRLVDYDTLVFILGMMILVSYLEMTGFFERLESFLLARATTTRALLALVIASSGALSALVMNDTVCLMLTPVVLRLAKRARLPPAPYLIALATASNIGSAATPTGNPQNMIVALRSGMPFAAFAARLAPLAAAGLALDYLALCWAYPAEFAKGKKVALESPPSAPVRGALLYVCLGGVGLLLALFIIGVRPPLAAISVAALLILAGAAKPREAFKHVDWELLLLFSGLFIVMGAARQAGLLGVLFSRLGALARASAAVRLGAVSFSSAVLSNLVSNVPCVIFFVHLLPSLGDAPRLWLALSMASTIAGNLTVIGSMANLIVFEAARHECKVGFWEYFRAAAPLTVFLIAAGTGYLLLAA